MVNYKNLKKKLDKKVNCAATVKANAYGIGDKPVVKSLIKDGCKILDIGGESTRPGSKEVEVNKEWNRIFPTLSKIKKMKKIISLDTRKSFIMKKGIQNKVNLINDVSGFQFDESF